MCLNHVELDIAVPRGHQDEVLKNLHWIDPRLDSLSFDRDDERMLCYRYRSDNSNGVGDAPAAVREQLKSIAERIARSMAVLPVRVVHTSAVESVPGCAEPYEQLCRLGYVRTVGNGFHVYAGLMSDLYHALDAEFRHRALALGVCELKFPALIELDTLARAGYLGSFHHNANFVAHLPEQAEAIVRFQSRMKESNDVTLSLADQPTAPPDAALSPTVCYHYYRAMESTELAADLVGATAISPCYRFEGRAMTGLRRLREFNMREIMFLGAEPRVLAARDRLLDVQKVMLEFCGLQARIQGATDPFFLDTDCEKRVFQLGFDLKQEVQAWLPDDETWLAIGSVNYHQDFFGTRFDIRLRDGGPVHSCCLGFGLDRWCMAIFAQYGLDPREWPEPLQASLASNADRQEPGAYPKTGVAPASRRCDSRVLR